jgi:hypothetical protein
MRILFLDDAAERWRKFRMANIGRVIDWAESAEAAITLLGTNSYDLISLDHDLKIEHYNRTKECPHTDGFCGMTVVDHMCSRRRLFGGSNIHVHTLSESAGRDMVDRLRAAGLSAHYRPFRF